MESRRRKATPREMAEMGRVKKIKKLPPEIITFALDSIDNKQYSKLLHDILEDHIRSVKAKNQYDLKVKLLRYGLSKGFESSLLYDILNDMDYKRPESNKK